MSHPSNDDSFQPVTAWPTAAKRPQQSLIQGVRLGEPIQYEAINSHHEEEKTKWAVQRQTAEQEASVIVAKAKQEAEALLVQASQEARELVEKAHQRAAAIEAEGEAKVQALLEQAFQEGFQQGGEQGLQEGYNQAANETLSLLQAAKTVASTAYRLQRTVFTEQASNLHALLMTVCQQVLGHASTHYPAELLQQLLITALEQLEVTGHATVVIHPERLALLTSLHPEITHALHENHHLRFLPDETLEPQQCHLLSQQGDWLIDANKQIEALLNQLRPVLTELLPSVEDLEAQALAVHPSEEALLQASTLTHPPPSTPPPPVGEEPPPTLA
ncbi:MAG: FliH/SctL family protein [Vampirovibrionales bacterium]